LSGPHARVNMPPMCVQEVKGDFWGEGKTVSAASRRPRHCFHNLF